MSTCMGEFMLLGLNLLAQWFCVVVLFISAHLAGKAAVG